MNSFDPGTRRCCFVCCIVLTSWCRSQRDMRCRPMWCLREESGAWNKRQRCGKSGETSRKEWLSMRVVARFRSYVMFANWNGTKQQTGDKPIKIGVQLTISGNQRWRLLENNVFVSNKLRWRLWFPAHLPLFKTMWGDQPPTSWGSHDLFPQLLGHKSATSSSLQLEVPSLNSALRFFSHSEDRMASCQHPSMINRWFPSSPVITLNISPNEPLYHHWSLPPY